MTSKDWRPTAFVETAPGVVTDEEAEASRAERRRTLYEIVRHLMTLDAAALVFTVTLVGKAFSQPVQRASVGIAVIAFLVSLAGGALSNLMLLASQPRAGAPHMSSRDLRFYIASAVLTAVGFILGMALLAAFFWANWFR